MYVSTTYEIKNKERSILITYINNSRIARKKSCLLLYFKTVEMDLLH